VPIYAKAEPAKRLKRKISSVCRRAGLVLEARPLRRRNTPSPGLIGHVSRRIIRTKVVIMRLGGMLSKVQLMLQG